MKKRILFVIDSLLCAGGEKSLVTLLNVIDYTKYDVDLQLFSYGGELEVYVPKEVNLLPPLPFISFVSKGLFQNLLNCYTRDHFLMLQSRLKYSYLLRKNSTLRNSGKARLYWQSVSQCIPTSSNSYDFAIAYAQCVPTFYVIDKVQAGKKFCWVNCIYHLEGIDKEYQVDYYKKMNKIICVSQSSFDCFSQVYPEFSDKMTIIKDLIDERFITELANKPCKIQKESSSPNFLTVARLNKEMKGFDIALEACRILRDRNIPFKWYVLGRGPYEVEMKRDIAKDKLESCFILLGTDANPYPYYKNAHLYVQTSRHEGFGLSIAEARLLNIPVVTTEFDAVYVQMVPGKNGLVVPQDPQKVADAIERILTDTTLYQRIVSYLRREKKGNIEELQKFYTLLK